MGTLANSFPSRAEAIYEILYERIKHRTFQPGQHLVEQDLANELGVSKTPVREALRKLNELGLVVIEPYRGAYVAEFSINTLIEIMDIRAVLDGLAARKAVEHVSADQIRTLESLVTKMERVAEAKDPRKWIDLNWRFHNLIAKASKNTELITLLSTIQEKMILSSALGIATNIATSVMEHQKILSALKSGDPDSAERFARWHVENTEKRVALLTGLNKSAPVEIPDKHQDISEAQHI